MSTFVGTGSESLSASKDSSHSLRSDELFAVFQHTCVCFWIPLHSSPYIIVLFQNWKGGKFHDYIKGAFLPRTRLGHQRQDNVCCQQQFEQALPYCEAPQKEWRISQTFCPRSFAQVHSKANHKYAAGSYAGLSVCNRLLLRKFYDAQCKASHK